MFVLRFMVAICLAVILPLLIFRYIEKRTLFYPTKEIELSPASVGLDYQDTFFKTIDNLMLNGWFVSSNKAKYTILFCHGNAGNISHRIEKLKFFSELGCNVFIFDYRGYGRSQGSPSEIGFYKDAKAAYDYLLSRGINSDQIIGYGESIGGAVIVDLAYKEIMKAVIIDSSISSVKDMVKHVYYFVPSWIFVSRFDSESKIKSIKIQKLIIHSLNDEIVPYQLGKKLYEVSAEPKDFLEIHGGHNSGFYESMEFLRIKIGDFIKRLK